MASATAGGGCICLCLLILLSVVQNMYLTLPVCFVQYGFSVVILFILSMSGSVFFSVLVFFFISGYGMEVTFARHRALTRLPRFIAVLLFFALLYFLVTGDFVYPTAWYILAYSSVMILYRFFRFFSPGFYSSFSFVSFDLSFFWFSC